MPRPVGDSLDVSALAETEIAALGDLDLEALRVRYRNLFGRVAPVGLSKPLLARLIAYRRQAEVLGDLDAKSLLALKQITGTRPRASAEKEPSVVARPTLPTGTMLLREWDGQSHRVTVMESGFAWNGVVYSSLSRIAPEITGTNWNGFVFFGLDQKQKGKPPDVQDSGKVLSS